MNKNTVKGTAKEIEGKAKKAVGRAAGNRRLEAEGEADRVRGVAQRSAGRIQDAARGK